MLPRANFGETLRWATAAAKAGGAALGLAIVVSSPDPELVLGVLGIALLVVGGMTWTRGRRSAIPLRILFSLSTIVLARLALGPSGGALAALLLALGRVGVRPADAVLGLAIFGGTIAVLGGARRGLILVFWVLGLAIAFLGPLAVRLSRYLARRSFLTVERTKAARLGPEN